jgi:hypothetical protein
MAKGLLRNRFWDLLHGNRGDEAVAASRDRLDEPRVLGVVIKRGPKPLEDDVKTPVKIDVRSLGPQALPQLLSSHNFAWTLEQQHQELERLILDFDPKTATCERIACGICLE